MRKLLVLGSNFGSVGMVQRAKERGIYTIVTDYLEPSNSNAKLYCDECWDISTTETEQLAQKCIEEHVDAITCGVSEFTSELTFKLCDRLGLPKYGSWEAWSVARNKRKFKDLCKQFGVPVAEDYYITDPFDPKQTEGIKYPVVIKPIDCGGNLGVSFCENQKELQAAFVKAQEVSDHKDTIICERRLNGKGYTAAYAFAEGESSLINFFSWHAQDGEPTNIYSVEVTTTGLLDMYNREINEGIRKVFKAAGYHDGFGWVETMTDSDGHMYVLETGYRLLGGMIPYTYQDVLGFNALDWYMDCFLGIKHTKDELPAPQTKEYPAYGVTYELWNREAGTIKEIVGLEKVRESCGNAIIDFARRPGYQLKPYSVMGQIVFSAPNRQAAIETIQFINRYVHVYNEEGTDVLIHFTDFYKIV